MIGFQKYAWANQSIMISENIYMTGPKNHALDMTYVSAWPRPVTRQIHFLPNHPLAWVWI